MAVGIGRGLNPLGLGMQLLSITVGFSLDPSSGFASLLLKFPPKQNNTNFKRILFLKKICLKLKDKT